MRRTTRPSCRAAALAAFALGGLLACAGCESDRKGSIIEASPRIDPLLPHEARYANAGELFTLDIEPYLSDDLDEPWQLVCSVVSGPGSFSGQTYENTFTTAGTHYIIVSVTDSTLNVTESYFYVIVDYVGNEAPVVQAGIPQQTAYLGGDFYFNVGSYVTDDIDPVADLDYSVAAGPGEFIGPIFHDVYGSLGIVTISFVVTDSGGKTGSGSFDVDVLPP